MLLSPVLCKSWQEINIEIKGWTGIAKLGKTPNPNTIQKRGVAEIEGGKEGRMPVCGMISPGFEFPSTMGRLFAELKP